MTYTPIPQGTEPWDEQVNGAFIDQDQRIDANAAAIISANDSIGVLNDGLAGVNDDIAGIDDEISDIQDVNGQQWNEITINRGNIAKVNDFVPFDYGLVAWTYDPVTASSTLNIPVGILQMCRVNIKTAATISTLGVGVNTAATNFTTGNLLGLYDQSGTLLGQTAEQATNWGTTGWRPDSLLTPVDIDPGNYYLAVLANYSTGTALNLIRGSNLGAGPEGQLVNLGLSNAEARFATFGSGLTALPATIDMSTRAANRTAWWLTAS